MMRPLRILHVNEVANVGSTLVQGLRTLGHDASLLRLQLQGGHYSDFLKLFMIPTRIRELLRVNRKIISARYDIVHIHYAYLGVLGIVKKYPFFIHCHGSDVRMVRSDVMRWLPVSQSIKQAEACFFSTPDLANVVQGIRPDAIFLPNPINTDHFKPLGNIRSLCPVRVLIISSLSDLKGVSIAFEAIRILRNANSGIEVSAFSNGLDENKYLGTPGVKFFSHVTYSEMPNVIGAHDIVIGQFSEGGSLGMSELEAMACGRPVICYFSHPEWYPELPPVLSANEPHQVAQLLIRLITDPELRFELGHQGRDWVQKYHDHLKVSRQLLKFYCAK
jgi:glycosyltransferase involved in cell wall biosynthesis